MNTTQLALRDNSQEKGRRAQKTKSAEQKNGVERRDTRYNGETEVLPNTRCNKTTTHPRVCLLCKLGPRASGSHFWPGISGFKGLSDVEGEATTRLEIAYKTANTDAVERHTISSTDAKVRQRGGKRKEEERLRNIRISRVKRDRRDESLRIPIPQ
jgi:hypothetical protein